jgi:hypothetical protein
MKVNKGRWLTVTVGVEMIQEHAVATTFEARAFRATSSGQGWTEVVDDLTARSSRRLTFAGGERVTVTKSVVVLGTKVVVSVVTVLFMVSQSINQSTNLRNRGLGFTWWGSKW